MINNKNAFGSKVGNYFRHIYIISRQKTRKLIHNPLIPIIHVHRYIHLFLWACFGNFCCSGLVSHKKLCERLLNY